MEYWFRRRQGLSTKDAGYGWMPTNWKGIMVITIMFGAIAGAFFALDMQHATDIREGMPFFVSILLILCIGAVVGDLKCDQPYIFKRTK